MKQISTLISIVALAASGVLFYLHFSQKDHLKKQQFVGENKKTDTTSQFSIAYFDIDTLQKNYDGFKEAEEKIKGKDLSNRNQLNSLNNSNQRRLRELQEKAPLMTQAEGEAAQRELAQLQQQFSQKEVELDQELKKLQMELMTGIQEKVEVYLKKYNQQKGYSFIFSYRPGELIYYKDTMYNITHHLVKGLNMEYAQLKKKTKE
jgi:outer membrane protein